MKLTAHPVEPLLMLPLHSNKGGAEAEDMRDGSRHDGMPLGGASPVNCRCEWHDDGDDVVLSTCPSLQAIATFHSQLYLFLYFYSKYKPVPAS